MFFQPIFLLLFDVVQFKGDIKFIRFKLWKEMFTHWWATAAFKLNHNIIVRHIKLKEFSIRSILYSEYFINKGSKHFKPPGFHDNQYNYWSAVMKHFIFCLPILALKVFAFEFNQEIIFCRVYMKLHFQPLKPYRHIILSLIAPFYWD